MTSLLDTSVLVPALVEVHPNHERAYPWLERAAAGEINVAVSNHSLAETYATMTKLPVRPKIPPGLASRLLRDGTVALTLVPLTAEDYHRTIGRIAELGLAGGMVYDALIACAAEKLDVEALVTFNVSDFRRVWPEGHDRIVAP